MDTFRSRVILALGVTIIPAFLWFAAPEGLLRSGPTTVKSYSQGSVWGYYFGTSHTDGVWDAWVIELDRDPRGGSFYLPPRLLVICDWSVDSAGSLRFRTGVAAGVTQFSFVGQVAPDSLVGRLVRRDIAAGMPEREWHVVFEGIGGRREASLQGRIAGSYSNLGFDEESGDLGGIELLAFPAHDGLRLGLTYTSGIPIGPFPVQDVSVEADTVRFGIRQGAFRQRFVGIVKQDDRIVLHEDGPATIVQSGLPAELPRKLTVREFFDQPRAGECG